MHRAVFIPTYRRTELLLRCVLSIIIDCKKYEINDLDIFISSNEYNEVEEELILGLKHLYEPLHYEFNKTNIGIDLNMKKAFFLEGIDYVLMMGDDDEIVPGFVKRFYDETNKSDVSFFVMNLQNRKGERVRDFKEDVVYSNMNQAFADLYDKMTYGSLIARIDNKEHFANVDRYVGTYHLYSGALWDMVKDGGKVKTISYPEVIIGDVPKSYSRNYNEVLRKGVPKWYDELPSVYLPEKERARKEFLMYLNGSANRGWEK